MTIDPDRLYSWPFEDVVQTYTPRDTMFYALSIGLGADPADKAQLAYVYEKNLQAFPTMALVLGHPGAWVANPDTGIDVTKVVYGEEILTLHRPLPPAGTIRAREQVTGIVDKGEGRGALLYSRRTIVDHASNEPLATIDHTFFCRADGGFGGPGGPIREPVPVPTIPPPLVVDIATLPQAALLYRLNADYNPLHCDPETAAAAGFSRPILHGLCTLGIAAHSVVGSCCGYDATRLRLFQARFTAPVFPGETISVEMWPDGEEIFVRAWVREREAKVLDNGRALRRL